MGWEDIIKRPFDVTEALRQQRGERYSKLSKPQILKKYLDPYFLSSVRGGTRTSSIEDIHYDKGLAPLPEAYDKTVTDIDGWNNVRQDDEGFDRGYFQSNRKVYPPALTRSDRWRLGLAPLHEMAIPKKDWNEFPDYVKSFINSLEPEYIENKYKIIIETISSDARRGYILRYTKR